MSEKNVETTEEKVVGSVEEQKVVEKKARKPLSDKVKYFGFGLAAGTGFGAAITLILTKILFKPKKA